MEADVLEKRLLEKGIMVREMKSFGAPGCLRITIGTEEANDATDKSPESNYGIRPKKEELLTRLFDHTTRLLKDC